MTDTIHLAPADARRAHRRARRARRRISAWLSTHPRARLALLLSAPLFWLGVVYIVALVAAARHGLLDRRLVHGRDHDGLDARQHHHGRSPGSLYQTVTLRTLGVALAVTVIDVAIALPIAFYMAKVASPRVQRHPRHRGAHAAVGELPRQGVRVALGALAGRHPRVAPRAVRPADARATA